jgi:Domain of unknown function (DUF6438)
MRLLTKTILAAIGCFAVASCSKPKEAKEEWKEVRAAPWVSVASNIPPVYMPFFSVGMDPNEVETARSRLPFESVSLRRTPCFGTCPVYEMVLHRDGKAELDAQAHTSKLGKFTGEVTLFTYGRLCYLIESSHFSEMNSNYEANVTDLPTCIVTVSNGTTMKSVSDYGRVGPIQLWAIQEVLDRVKDEIEWKPAQ